VTRDTDPRRSRMLLKVTPARLRGDAARASEPSTSCAISGIGQTARQLESLETHLGSVVGDPPWLSDTPGGCREDIGERSR